MPNACSLERIWTLSNTSLSAMSDSDVQRSLATVQVLKTFPSFFLLPPFSEHVVIYSPVHSGSDRRPLHSQLRHFHCTNSEAFQRFSIRKELLRTARMHDQRRRNHASHTHHHRWPMWNDWSDCGTVVSAHVHLLSPHFSMSRYSRTTKRTKVTCGTE